MKKSILKIATLTLAAVMCLGLIACDDVKGGNKNDKKAVLFSTDTEVFAFGAASTGAILQGLSEGPATSAAEGTATTNQSVPTTEGAATANEGTAPTGENAPTNTPNDAANAKIEAVKGYVAMVDTFLGSEPISVVESASDRAEYAFKLTAKNADLSGNTYTYVLYYNETANRQDADDKWDNEVSSRIEGVMVSGTAEYRFTGEKETENDESEIEIVAKIDELNYVKVTQEKELGESGFKYAVYSGGVLTDSFELEIENKAGKSEVELAVMENGVKKFFDFERKTVNGADYIEIETNENGVVTKIEVYVTKNADGTESYRFESGGSRVSYDKPDFDDDDDDDDDRYDD